jgi:asparagine synthase (glutamine-hydrolysing)
MHPRMRSIPASMLAALAGDKSRAVLDRLPLGDQMHHALRSDRLRRLAHLLEAADERDMLHRLSTGGAATFGGQNLDSHSTTPQFSDVVSRLIFEDMAGYLPGDILVKLDRATMANSLEGRCPLLDHRVIEFAWQLPTNMKVRHGRGKWILRQVLRRYVPDRLIDRPKQGLDVPIGTWLRGPLHGWASDLLASLRRSDDRLVDMTKVDASWRDHLAGRQDHSRDLWSVLMFQAWQNQVRQADVSHDTPSRQSVMTGV